MARGEVLGADGYTLPNERHGFTDLFEVLVDSWSVKQFITDG